MNLNEYENQITEIQQSDLTPGEKRAALELTAKEIGDCAWQAGASLRAKQVAASAVAAAQQYPDGGLAALDALAKRGKLAPK